MAGTPLWNAYHDRIGVLAREFSASHPGATGMDFIAYKERLYAEDEAFRTATDIVHVAQYGRGWDFDSELRFEREDWVRYLAEAALEGGGL